MRAALRPYVTAGVALVGASAIAVAPIAATPPDVTIANPDVHLTASPLDPYLTALLRARTNIEILFLQVLADPELPFTLEDLLDGLLADPAANLQEFVDGVEGLGPFLQLNLPALLGDAADDVQAAIDRAAEGNIDLAVVNLMFAYLSLAKVVAEAVSIPLPLLGPKLEQVTTDVLAGTLNAATGPVISGIGKAGVAIQNIINVLNDEDPEPGALLGALIGAPGTIADGVLNGFPIVPSPIAFPGILTPGSALDPTKPNPGPVFLAIGLAEGIRALLTAQPDMLTSVNRAPMNQRIVPFDVNATSGIQQKQELGPVVATPPGPDLEGTGDPDEGTNIDVKAIKGGTDLPDGNQHRPRSVGANSHGGASLSTLGEGIRDGVRGFRQGVRDAVKTFAGRGDRTGTVTDDAGESP